MVYEFALGTHITLTWNVFSSQGNMTSHLWSLQGGAPVINWLINPMNTIDISSINQSEIGVMWPPTEPYRMEAPPCTYLQSWPFLGILTLQCPRWHSPSLFVDPPKPVRLEAHRNRSPRSEKAHSNGRVVAAISRIGLLTTVLYVYIAIYHMYMYIYILYVRMYVYIYMNPYYWVDDHRQSGSLATARDWSADLPVHLQIWESWATWEYQHYALVI